MKPWPRGLEIRVESVMRPQKNHVLLMKTCKGPHTEGNKCLQIIHFSATMLDLVGVNA